MPLGFRDGKILFGTANQLAVGNPCTCCDDPTKRCIACRGTGDNASVNITATIQGFTITEPTFSSACPFGGDDTVPNGVYQLTNEGRPVYQCDWAWGGGKKICDTLNGSFSWCVHTLRVSAFIPAPGQVRLSGYLCFRVSEGNVCPEFTGDPFGCSPSFGNLTASWSSLFSLTPGIDCLAGTYELPRQASSLQYGPNSTLTVQF